jgi:hypothetical protein
MSMCVGCSERAAVRLPRTYDRAFSAERRMEFPSSTTIARTIGKSHPSAAPASVMKVSLRTLYSAAPTATTNWHGPGCVIAL